jgi:molybdopterin-guanine dinucleotide biosynthesis protein A
MTLTAALIAGGLSRRMGTDKAALMISGEPLWARQLRLIRSLAPQAVFVSARSVPAWLPADVKAVLDQPPSRGPLSGLSASLQALRTTHLFALAVDLPAMTADHAAKLWSRARPGAGVIPVNGDYFEPLCAIYPAEALPVALELLAGEDFSLQSFAKTLAARGLARTCRLTAEDIFCYLNANTPGDLQSAETKFRA